MRENVFQFSSSFPEVFQRTKFSLSPKRARSTIHNSVCRKRLFFICLHKGKSMNLSRSVFFQGFYVVNRISRAEMRETWLRREGLRSLLESWCRAVSFWRVPSRAYTRLLQGSCRLPLAMLRSMFIHFFYFQYLCCI